MATPKYSLMDRFDSDTESIESYLERVAIYFRANRVEERNQVDVFLSLLSSKTYSLLRDLEAPEKPGDKTFAELSDTLTKHFQPKRKVISERFKFHKRTQAVGESVIDFVAELRKLSKFCKFEAHLDQALRDQFVSGLRNGSIQKHLLTEPDDLAFARAVELAEGMEAAEFETQQWHASPDTANIRKVTQHSSPSQPRTSCYRCGGRHLSSDCRFKEAVCHFCQKKGHIAKVCKSKKREQSSAQNADMKKKKPTKTGQCNFMETGDNEDEPPSELPPTLPLFQLKEHSSHPIVVSVLVNDKPLEMELDTGAAVSIISEDTHQSKFPGVPLQKASVKLKTYTGQTMEVCGQLDVTVRYNSQEYTLPLCVVAGPGPTLLGRDWLRSIHLDWKAIGVVALDKGKDQIQGLQQAYHKVFRDELGTISGFTATLNLRPDSKPVFCKPRPVPFALKEALGKELDRLETAGILEKVSHSNWATPVVVVPKADGSLRLCGDYKQTVNPQLDVDKYPLPNPTELFASLAGGCQFSKIDLSHAYQQLQLDESSRECVTINTHQGLYRYTRLPFGIASAPAIFQRTMDTILQGIPRTCCYLDDILVTGSTREEHLQNLETVLQRLDQRGVRVKKSKCEFLKDSVEYLGHKIDASGLHATTKKVDAVINAPQHKPLTTIFGEKKGVPQMIAARLQRWALLLSAYESMTTPSSTRVLQHMAMLMDCLDCLHVGQTLKNSFMKRMCSVLDNLKPYQ